MWFKSLNRISTALRSLANRAAEGVLPETCAGCGLPGSWFCERCLHELEYYPEAGCFRCGRLGRRRSGCAHCLDLFPPTFLCSRAGYVFSGVMRRAVHRFKYDGEFQRGQILGEMLISRLSQILVRPSELDVVIPVPLHPRRYRQRGFNQSEKLAVVVANGLSRPMVDAVQRVRYTASQTGLNEIERSQNVAGAFVVSDEHVNQIRGRRVLIVDDVSTTGATFGAVSEALDGCGARSIQAIALARDH